MSDRLDTLKAKHPDRAKRLDRLVSPLLGMSGKEESRVAREALDFVESRIIACLFGDEDPSTPTSTATVP